MKTKEPACHNGAPRSRTREGKCTCWSEYQIGKPQHSLLPSLTDEHVYWGHAQALQMPNEGNRGEDTPNGIPMDTPMDTMDTPMDIPMGTPTPTDAVASLREVRCLWAQLDHAVRLWSRTWTYPLAHVLLFSMSLLLLSVFGISIPLLRGETIDDRLAGMFCALFQNGYNVSRVCSTGYRMRMQVRRRAM